MIRLTRTSADHPDFQRLVVLLDRDLKIRDGDDHSFYSQYNKIDKIKYAIVAYVNGGAVGIGAIREISSESMEIKRMYVLPEKRGQGIARTILTELESWAKELNFVRCVLETGKKQPEAIRLYRKAGYHPIANYGPYENVDNSVCMSKDIA